RRLPSVSHTGRRLKPCSRANAKTSVTALCVETVTVLLSGVVICCTVKFCKSNTRLIMVRSSLLSPCEDSCMTHRSSSRLPNKRQVNRGPPDHLSSHRETHATGATRGRSAKYTTRNGTASAIHSRFGYRRKIIFGSNSHAA